MVEAYDNELNSIDALTERDMEPTRWMQAMERVIDSYKREVEILRVRVASLEANTAVLRHRLDAAESDIEELSK